MNVLIGDIGGTNCRLAINTNSKIKEKKIYKTNDYNSLLEILKDYSKHLKKKKIKLSDEAVFSVAGKINGSSTKLSNSSLKLDIGKIKKEYNLKVKLINDLEALGYAIPKLKEKDIKIVNKGVFISGISTIIAPGTGLGESKLIWKFNKIHVVDRERGHRKFIPKGDFERKLCDFIKKKKSNIEFEDILSGRGLENVYFFLANRKLSAVSISNRVDSDKNAKKTLKFFYRILGRFTKLQVLENESHSGVFLCGGILQKNEFLKKDFMSEFLDSRGYLDELQKMPIFVIIKKDPILDGLI